ncbi:MAG: DUF169 domain-containing protein [Syntrophaceae bacterium]|nr:DUF169 domain-containing protein [Syntrophaceae bacterium]
MESRIAEAVRLKIPPVGLLWADEKPDRAMMFQAGKWGCVMWLVAAATKGKTAACDVTTFGCVGGGVGLGFGNQYRNFPDGEEGFCHFLSTGNAEREGGKELAEQVRPFLRDEAFDHFLHGERYIKDPALVRRFLASLPMREIPARYVVFKPLADVDPERDNLRTVIFFADPDRLSALVVLANYGRGDNENVIIPYAAGCQTVGIYPYREAESPLPRAVVGLTDLSARLYLRRQLGGDLLTFAVPKALFEEMEGNIRGSFLERSTWQGLLEGC